MRSTLQDELARLNTFTEWPKRDVVSAELLARYGFFYTGESDIVRCNFCLVELGSWERSDDIVMEHLRWSRYCPLMNKRHTNNVPLPGHENFLDDVPQPEPDVVGSGSVDHSTTPEAIEAPAVSSEVQLIDHVPAVQYNSQVLRQKLQPLRMPLKYPTFAQPQQRLSSFEDWPVALTQKPQELAEAGFFYTGKGDLVTCFSCGGRLKGWEPNDDPWQEHAKHYDDCQFLLLTKGFGYVEACKKSTASVTPETPDRVGGTRSKQEESGEALENESQPDPVEWKLCKVCYENEANTVFLPCGHVVACSRCAAATVRCPLCNENYKAVFRVHLG